METTHHKQKQAGIIILAFAAILVAAMGLMLMPGTADAKPYKLVGKESAHDFGVARISNGAYTYQIDNHGSGIGVVRKVIKKKGEDLRIENVGYVGVWNEGYGTFSAVCGKFAYITYYDSMNLKKMTYVLNTKTDKVKKLKKMKKSFGIVASSGKYLLTYRSYSSGYDHMKVYLYKTTKKGNLKKVKRLAVKGQALGFSGKKVYFAKQSKDFTKTVIYSAKRNGSNIKKVKTINSTTGATIVDTNMKSCTITGTFGSADTEKTYKFVYKTEKLSRVS